VLSLFKNLSVLKDAGLKKTNFTLSRFGKLMDFGHVRIRKGKNRSSKAKTYNDKNAAGIMNHFAFS